MRTPTKGTTSMARKGEALGVPCEAVRHGPKIPRRREVAAPAGLLLARHLTRDGASSRALARALGSSGLGKGLISDRLGGSPGRARGTTSAILRRPCAAMMRRYLSGTLTRRSTHHRTPDSAIASVSLYDVAVIRHRSSHDRRLMTCTCCAVRADGDSAGRRARSAEAR